MYGLALTQEWDTENLHDNSYESDYTIHVTLFHGWKQVLSDLDVMLLNTFLLCMYLLVYRPWMDGPYPQHHVVGQPQEYGGLDYGQQQLMVCDLMYACLYMVMEGYHSEWFVVTTSI